MCSWNPLGMLLAPTDHPRVCCLDAGCSLTARRRPALPLTARRRAALPWTPQVEKENAFEVKADIPGVTKNDIKVTGGLPLPLLPFQCVGTLGASRPQQLSSSRPSRASGPCAPPHD